MKATSAMRVRATPRFDHRWWRRAGEFGYVHGPAWWKRGAPPVIAAIVFGIARERRAAVLRNQRQVRGGARSRLRERWDAYRVFAESARSMTESLEQWGPHPPPLTLEVPQADLFRAALAEGRGLVVATAHFGSWEVGTRFLSSLGRPVNLVTAPEWNQDARDVVHRLRTRDGVNVIDSDQPAFPGLPVLRALRRDEVVAMQIDPWVRSPGTREIAFCGRPVPFEAGPFVTARMAGAPLIPVFAFRTGIRRYELRVAGRFDPRTPGDTTAAFTATVRAFEHLVRQHPAQWPMFDDVWREPPADVGHAGEPVPRLSTMGG